MLFLTVDLIHKIVTITKHLLTFPITCHRSITWKLIPRRDRDKVRSQFIKPMAMPSCPIIRKLTKNVCPNVYVKEIALLFHCPSMRRVGSRQITSKISWYFDKSVIHDNLGVSGGIHLKNMHGHGCESMNVYSNAVGTHLYSPQAVLVSGLGRPFIGYIQCKL